MGLYNGIITSSLLFSIPFLVIPNILFARAVLTRPVGGMCGAGLRDSNRGCIGGSSRTAGGEAWRAEAC